LVAIRHITDDPNGIDVTPSAGGAVMASGLKTIIYPVKDIAEAKARFSKLFGAQPYIDEPYYAAFDIGGHDLGLDPNGHKQGMTGPVPFWHVDDINAAVQQLVDAGGTEQQAVRDVGGGNLTATVVDADGNTVGLIQAA
jgi:predicted enzyme related to lactoylglutathione lyase